MRVFVAGGSGVLGRRLVPQLVERGHHVTATTTSAAKVGLLEQLGAEAVVMDGLDAASVGHAVASAEPEAIIHQMTAINPAHAGKPDIKHPDQWFAGTNRLRVEGTRNLVEAAKAAGVETMIAQSIAWLYLAGETPASETDALDSSLPPYAGIAALEDAVAEMPRGVVLRYGALYGPGTWYAPDGAIAQRVKAGSLRLAPAWTSFVHADDAAAAAMAALDWPAGPVNIVDDEPATTAEWLPVYSAALGAPTPGSAGKHAATTGRPVSNAKALGLGWKPQTPSWRAGFADME